MFNPAVFIILRAYICSTLLLLPRGEKWGSHAHSLHQIWPSIAKRAGSWLPCRGWHTQHHTSAYHTFASTSQLLLSRKHFRFKPTPSFAITMLDCGRGRRAAKRSRAPAVTQWQSRSHDGGGGKKDFILILCPSQLQREDHIFVVGIGHDITGASPPLLLF